MKKIWIIRGNREKKWINIIYDIVEKFEKKNDDVFALMWLVDNDKSKKIKYEVYCRGKKKLLMSIVGKKK